MTAADAAAQAARLADLDPRRAIAVARSAAREALREGDLAAAATAERALGHALVQCGDVEAAIRHLRRAVGYGTASGSAVLSGEARIKLAYAMILRGRPKAALTEIDSALLHLDGPRGATARAQRGIILREIGRLDEALADLDIALPQLRRNQDPLGVAKVLLNRGVLHAERHAFGAAVRDLHESEQINRQLGRGLAVGLVAQSLGFVETLRGDVPAALANLRRAEEIIAARGGQLAAVLQDHGDLLLSAGLVSEARAVADEAIVAATRERRTLRVPELWLLRGQASALEGDWRTALSDVSVAAQGFKRQQRAEWAALAQVASLRARLALGDRVRLSGRAVESIVDALAASGWPAAALEARLVAARLSAKRGETDAALGHLREAQLVAGRRGPAVLRARGWYAKALLCRSTGDQPGARAAVRSGLRILDDHAAALGAADLRVHSAAHRVELSELGLRMAFEDGKLPGIFEWAERGRASRLVHRAVRPPDDPDLAALLAELRAVSVEIDKSGTGRGQARLVARQVQLERQIRDRSRLQRVGADARPAGPASHVDIGAALGERALVEFVRRDGELLALTLVGGRLRLRSLAPQPQVRDLVQRIPFALRRLATGRGEIAAARALLDSAATRLDSLLFGPMPEIVGRPLVLVPTGAVHSVPWSVLPTCAGRPVTVSASATLWHTANGRPTPVGGPVASVAGPGLPGAREEALAVAAAHGAQATVDGAATVAAALQLLGSSRLAHLATHGRLSPDNPLFSSLSLHDGPLVVYDVQRLRSAPHTVVLASCDSGRSMVGTGDELLGLAATFVEQGAAVLVASVVPVPDAQTAPLMVELHRRLAAGESVATALASAQEQVRGRGAVELAAAAGFVCFGAG